MADDASTIEQLRDVIRLREKEIQDKDAKFSKLKLQTKAKLVSMNKEIDELRKSSSKSGPGVASSASSSTINEPAEREEDAAVTTEISRSPNANNNNNNTKVVVLRQKLEGKEEEVKLLKRKLEEKEGLVQVLQENMTSLASGDEEKFAIISQAIQKDEKIFRLNDKILEHDKVVTDLQENIREKEEVIQSRNRAFKLIGEELNTNRLQIAEKDALINQLRNSSALDKDGANSTSLDLTALKNELEVKEKALLQLNDRFAITKEQMNHLQEEFASLADKSKKEIAEKDEKLVQVEALYRETANEYHQLYEKLGSDASSSSNSAREEALINAVSKAKAEAKELEELFVQEKVNLRGMIEEQGKEMTGLRKTLEAKEKELMEFIESTKDDLTKKDETILDLESQAEDNMEVFQEKLVLIEHLRGSIRDLQKQLREKAEQQQSLSGDKDSSEAERNELVVELGQARANSQKTLDELSRVKQNNAELESLVADMRQQIDSDRTSWQRKKDVAIETTTRLEEELASKVAAYAKVEDELQLQRDSVAALESLAADLRRQLESSEDEKRQSDESIIDIKTRLEEELAAHVAASHKALEDAAEERNTLLNRIETEEETRRLKEVQLARVEERNVVLSEQSERLVAECEAHKEQSLLMASENETLKEQLERLGMDLAEKSRQMEETMKSMSDDKDSAIEIVKTRLEEEVRSSETTIGMWKENVTALTSEVETLRKEKVDAEEVNTKLRGDEEERIKVIESLQAQGLAMRTEYEEMRLKYEEARTESEQLRTMCEEARNVSEETKVSNEKTRIELEETLAKVEEMRSETDRMKIRNEELEIVKGEIENQLSEAMKNLEEARNEKDSADAALKIEEKALIDAKEELNRLNIEIKHSNQLCQEKDRLVQIANAELERLVKEKEEFDELSRKSGDEKDAEAQRLRSLLNDLQQESAAANDAKEIEMQKLVSTLEELRRDLAFVRDEKETDKKKFESTLGELRQELSSAKDEKAAEELRHKSLLDDLHQKASSSSEEKDVKIQEMTMKLSELEQTVAQTTKTMTELQEAKSILEQRLRDEKSASEESIELRLQNASANDSLRREITTLSGKLATMEETSIQSQTHNVSLQQTIVELRVKYETFFAENESLNKTECELKERAREMDRQMRELDASKADVEAKMGQAVVQIQSLEANAAELTCSLKTKADDIERLNISLQSSEELLTKEKLLNEQLRGEISAVTVELDGFKAEAETQRTEIQRLNEKVVSETYSKEAELEALRATTAQGAKERENVEATLSEELKLVKLKLEKAKKLLKLKEENLNKLKSENETAAEESKRQLEAEKTGVANLRSVIAQRDEETSSLRQKIEELETNRNNNESILAESKKVKAQLEKLKSLSKNKISNLLSEKEELAKQVEEIGRAKDVLLEKEKADEEIIEQLARERDAVDNEKAQLEMEKEELAKRVEELGGKLEAFEGEISKLRSSVADKETIQDQLREISDVKRQLSVGNELLESNQVTVSTLQTSLAKIVEESAAKDRAIDEVAKKLGHFNQEIQMRQYQHKEQTGLLFEAREHIAMKERELEEVNIEFSSATERLVYLEQKVLEITETNRNLCDDLNAKIEDLKSVESTREQLEQEAVQMKYVLDKKDHQLTSMSAEHSKILNGYRNNEETCQHLREQVDELKKLLYKREETDVQNRDLLDSKTDLENLLRSKSDIANRLVNVLKEVQSVLDDYDSGDVTKATDEANKEKFGDQVDRLKEVLSKMKNQADQSGKLSLDLKDRDAKLSKLKLQLKAKIASMNSENEKLKASKEQYLNALRSIDNVMFGMTAEKDDGVVQMDFVETLEARIAEEKNRLTNELKEKNEKLMKLEEANVSLELNQNEALACQDQLHVAEVKRKEEMSVLEERCGEAEARLTQAMENEERCRLDLRQCVAKMEEITQENDALLANRDTLAIEREKLKQDLVGLTTNLNIFQSQNANLMEERNHFQKLCQEQQVQLVTTKASLDDVCAANDKIRDELVGRDEDRVKLQDQLKHVEKEVHELKAENEKMEAEIENLFQTQDEEAEKRRKAVAEEMKKMEEERRGALESLAVADERIQCLEFEREEIRKKWSSQAETTREAADQASADWEKRCEKLEDDNVALERRCNQLETMRQQLSSQMEKSVEEMNRLETIIKDHLNLISQLRDKEEGHSRKLEEIQTRLMVAQTEKETLEVKLTEVTAQSEANIMELQKSLADAQKVAEDTNVSLKNFQESGSKSDEEMTRLQHALVQNQGYVAEMKQRLQAAFVEIQDLRRQNEAFANEKASSVENEAKTSDELAELKGKIADFEAKLKEADLRYSILEGNTNEERNKHETMRAKMMAKLKQMKGDQIEAQKKAEQQQTALAEAEKNANDSSALMEKMREAQSQTQARMEELQSALAQAKNDMGRSTSLVDEMKANEVQIQAEIEHLQRSLAEAKTAAINYSSVIEKMRVEEVSMRSEIEGQRKSLAEAQKNQEESSFLISQQNLTLGKFQESESRISAEVSQWQQQLHQKEATVVELNQQLQAFVAENHELKKQSTSREEERSALQQNQAQVRHRYDILTAEFQKIQNANQELLNVKMEVDKLLEDERAKTLTLQTEVNNITTERHRVEQNYERITVETHKGAEESQSKLIALEKALKEKEGEIDRSKASLSELMEKLTRLETAKSEVSSALNIAEDEISRLREALEGSRNELKNFKINSDHLLSQFQARNDEIVRQNVKISENFKAQSKDLEAKLAQATSVNQGLSDRVQSSEKALIESQRRVDDLQQLMSAAEQSENQIKAELEDARQSAARLQAEVIESRSTIEELTSKNQRLLADENSELRSLREELRVSGVQNLEISARSEEMRKRIDELEATQKEAVATVEGKLMEEHSAKVNDLLAEIESVKAETEERLRAQAVEIRIAFDGKVAAVEMEKEALMEERSTMVEKMEAMTVEAGKLGAVIVELRSELEGRVMVGQEMKVTRDEMATRMESIASQLSVLREANQLVIAEKEELMTRMTQMEQMLHTKELEVVDTSVSDEQNSQLSTPREREEQLTQPGEMLTSERAELLSRLTATEESKIDTLASEKGQLNERLETLMTENSRLEIKVAELSSTIFVNETELARREAMIQQFEVKRREMSLQQQQQQQQQHQQQQQLTEQEYGISVQQERMLGATDESLIVPVADESTSAPDDSVVTIDVTDYNMEPLPPSLPSSPPRQNEKSSSDDVSVSLRAENDALRHRIQRLTHIEDHSIQLRCRVEDLERRLTEKDEEVANLRLSTTRNVLSDNELAEDDLEAGPRHPLLSSSLFRSQASPTFDTSSSTTGKTLVRQKTTAAKNLARFFCGVDQPNVKRAVAAAKRMPLIFWTYMILVHFFWFRCILSESVTPANGGGHGGL